MRGTVWSAGLGGEPDLHFCEGYEFQLISLIGRVVTVTRNGAARIFIPFNLSAPVSENVAVP